MLAMQHSRASLRIKLDRFNCFFAGYSINALQVTYCPRGISHPFYHCLLVLDFYWSSPHAGIDQPLPSCLQLVRQYLQNIFAEPLMDVVLLWKNEYLALDIVTPLVQPLGIGGAQVLET